MDALKKKLQSGRWSLLIVSQIATNSPWCKTEPKSARDCFPGCFLVTCGRYCDVWGTSLCFAPFRHLTLWRADQVRRLTGHDVDPGAKPSAQSFWHSGHLVRSATPRLNAVGALHTQGGPKCKTLRVVFKTRQIVFYMQHGTECIDWTGTLDPQFANAVGSALLDWLEHVGRCGVVKRWRRNVPMWAKHQMHWWNLFIDSESFSSSPCPMSFHEFVIVCGLWQQSPVEISSWWSPLPRSHQSLQDVDEDVRELAALTLLHADEVSDAAIASVLLWFCNAKNDSCLRNT